MAATISGWFPVGRHTADIMDSVVYPERMVELGKRFQKSIAVHRDWFMQALAELQDGEPMAYHPNMGLTPEEYADFQSLKDSVVSYSSGQEQIMITMDDGILGFQGTGRLEILDMVKLDLKENAAYISNVPLPFADTVVVTDPMNSFRSSWKGFSWKSGSSLDKGQLSLDSLSTMTITEYAVTVGRIERTQKSYLKVTAREMKQGVMELNLELPIAF
ncbi:MAG: hypothetical protein KJZ58_06095 [Flavobacteriales bacterium]|nr:hypothetical protein [Flavobacteriales bacterium]